MGQKMCLGSRNVILKFIFFPILKINVTKADDFEKSRIFLFIWIPAVVYPALDAGWVSRR